MTASLPTPLGPEMTMISGFGLGQTGSVRNDEPRADSRARSKSGLGALSIAGIEWDLWVSPILELNERNRK